MANPIALAVGLSRLIEITCPHCRKKKMATRAPKQFRICPSCHRRFAEPPRRKR